MARPRTDLGFVQIALDLFPAIMAADLSNREMIVLAEILLQCYGPAKRPTAVIDPVEVERLTGLHRNNVRRALAGLQAAGMIATTPDGSIDFIKDWETWKPKGESLIERLGGGIKRFALSAISRFGRKYTSRNGTIQEDSISTSTPIQTDSVTTVKPNPPGFCDSRKTDSKRIGEKVDESKNTSSHALELPTTYGESLAGAGVRASEELEIRHQSTPSRPPAAAESRSNPKANSLTPPKATAAPPPADIDSSSSSLHPDDAWPDSEVERVVTAARESWDELVAYEVKANYLLYDPDCLYRAIVDPVADRDAIKNRVGFIFSRARKYEDMGGPPPEVKVKAKVQPQPKSPLSRLPEYQVVPESIIPKQPACKPGESDEVLRQFGIHVERFAHLRPKERPRRPIPVRDLNRPQAS
jgi:hypothetical protein